ncbi:glycosyltransferase family 15 protein [Crepidotus variabilis]|uniref:Glycosyltransferase family 15 protein n=1 Tax=Crepidotus variabilis TaxID=179855 RepID=A0A9P6JSI0_9AGAR|nr:glycosyltransferase family 15 protein [Crepidotus variabilis]
MNAYGRYIIVALTLLISIHYLVSFTHEPYGRATSISNIVSKIKPGKSEETHTLPDKFPEDVRPVFDDSDASSYQRANASFVILCRNSDLGGTVRSVREMEDRFNRRYRYPYVFLNEEPFSDEFKEAISNLTPAQVEFGVIPHDHWYQPDSIDEEKATAAREKMSADNIIYGGSVSYRNMCRFNSGFFFRHPLMEKYKWYWRIEPDVHFHCDINYDPFTFMQQNNKTYSFTITMYEFEATIPTLWGHVNDFAKENPQFIAKNNAFGFMAEDGGAKYNLCHFWSNFEIADMDFWRSPAYTAFFEYLDAQGGFYYERWGDAPVHSIAAALFLSREQIHFFHDIGYEHNPYTHCPKDLDTWKKGRCSCQRSQSFDYDGYSCMNRWDRFMER